MKKLLLILLIIFSIFWYFFYNEYYLKHFIVFEWKTVTDNINREETKVLISNKSTFIWNITLKYWEIIFEDNSSFSWNIILEKWFIEIWKNVEINWDINFSWKITLWENSKINWNLNTDSDLFKNSTSSISWTKPNLFVTTDYPNFLEYFDVLPNSHKKEFGYIFLTSSNMDIRWVDLKPEEYFKWIYYYEDNKLKEFDFKNKEKLAKLYDNASKYINLIAERKVDRFSVWFTTLNYSFDKKRPDIYISEPYANSVLLTHEYGHVMDYAYWFIDNFIPKYPYIDKENSITEYGKFHVWEDFAEAYRYYVLHNNSFQEKKKNNPEITDKYNYLKTYVFNEKEYN